MNISWFTKPSYLIPDKLVNLYKKDKVLVHASKLSILFILYFKLTLNQTACKKINTLLSYCTFILPCITNIWKRNKDSVHLPLKKSFGVWHKKKFKKYFSAGVGRTGTFIALDSLLKQGRESGRINVFEFVKQMRQDRMTMVQTVVCLCVFFLYPAWIYQFLSLNVNVVFVCGFFLAFTCCYFYLWNLFFCKCWSMKLKQWNIISFV